MKGQILADIEDCFGVVASLKSDENVNQHVYATRKWTDEEKGKQSRKSNWRNNAVELSKIAAKINKQQRTSDLDLSEYMKDLQII